MDNNKSNEDYFLNNTFNFDEPFGFDSSNYDQGSDANLYRSGRPARPQLFLDTATPFVDQDQPFLTAYTGHEMTYQELLGEHDRQTGATVDAPMANNIDDTTGVAQVPVITGNISPPGTNDNSPEDSLDDDNDHYVVQHGTNTGNVRLINNSSGDVQHAIPNDNTQSTDGAKLRRSCVRCHTRKMKCIILAGSTPKNCEECSKKGLVCEFEQKKPYIRKPTASSK